MLIAHFIYIFTSEVNGKANHESRKERPPKRGGGGGRFEPYGNPSKRYRVFVSNIPYDVKWQALKDLMKEKGKFHVIRQIEISGMDSRTSANVLSCNGHSTWTSLCVVVMRSGCRLLLIV